MKIYFGDKLKKLRTDRNLTQEKLADSLGVSFQTISKWERGESYPDISLLPEIAMHFGITVDDLLCVNYLEKEKEISDFIVLFDNLTDNEEKQKLIENAIKLYPSDFRIQLRRMMMYISNTTNTYSEAMQVYPKFLSIYNSIQNGCTNDTIRITAKRYLIHFYKSIMRYPESQITFNDIEKLIDELPYMRDGKDFVRAYMLDDNHPMKSQACHDAIEEELGLLDSSLYSFSYIDWNDDNIPLKIKMLETIINLLKSVYDDENYGWCWRSIIFNHLRLGYRYYQIGNIHKALDNLNSGIELAKRFDSLDKETTMHSELFEGRVFDKNTIGSTFVATSSAKEFINKRLLFSDEFKSTEEYKKIMN